MIFLKREEESSRCGLEEVAVTGQPGLEGGPSRTWRTAKGAEGTPLGPSWNECVSVREHGGAVGMWVRPLKAAGRYSEHRAGTYCLLRHCCTQRGPGRHGGRPWVSACITFSLPWLFEFIWAWSPCQSDMSPRKEVRGCATTGSQSCTFINKWETFSIKSPPTP